MNVNTSSLDTFFSNNERFDVLTADLQMPSAIAALNWTGYDDNAKAAAIEMLKSYQRVGRIVPDGTIANVLVDNSFTSAHKITSIGKSRFTELISSGLGPNGVQQAQQIYAAAEARTNQAMHAWAVAQHVSGPYYQSMRVNHLGDDVNHYFNSIPEYSDFFGSLNYCECSECKSIFGPAAYFVDLMQLIEHKITQLNGATIPRHMGLIDRRPDLSTNITLTCENTNHTFPYIRIVNERLGALLSAQLGSGESMYQALAQMLFPFELPYHFHLDRIRTALGQFKIGLQDIYSLLGIPNAFVAAEIIQVSPESWGMLTTKETNTANLSSLFGVKDLSNLNDLSTFCNQTELLIPDAISLLTENLSSDEVTKNIGLQLYINQGGTTPVSITDNTVNGLNATNLDRINRFVRLSKQIGWSFSDLNWAITAVNKGAGDINPDTLTAIAWLQGISTTRGIPMGDLLPLLYDLRTYGVGSSPAGSQAPFDMVFNPPGTGKAYHPTYADNAMYQDPVTPWALNTDDDTGRKISAWLAAGSGLREVDLMLLVNARFANPTSLSLSVENLSQLYRHARLSSSLNFQMEEYLIFLRLFGWNQERFDAEELKKIFEVRDIMTRSRFNVYELDFIINSTLSPYIDPGYQAADLDDWFAHLQKILSRPKIRPHDSPDVKAEKQAELLEKLITQLAHLLNGDRKIIAALFDWKVGAPDHFITLDKVLAEKDLGVLSQFLLLAKKLRLSVKDIQSMQKHADRYFQNAPMLSVDILNLFLLKEEGNILGDNSGVLQGYMEATDVDGEATVLAGLLPLSQADIKTLLGMMTPSQAIPNLVQLQKINTIAQKIGAGVPLLIALTKIAGKGAASAADWAAYSAAADNTIALVRARHTAADWEPLFDQIDGAIQARLRDALVPLALMQMQTVPETSWVDTSRNLYEYLLIDVEMGAGTQISYVKEGLNALQLYLHRCREHLEPGVLVIGIEDAWWQWIDNYRIWEANRKIFLYPENYLDPNIRQNKTELFKKFEDALKRGTLDPESVDAAFKTYLEGFAELASLVYVDAYYTNVAEQESNDEPTFFFFARTQKQPYKFYYIQRSEGDIWSEWKAVNITINADHVTPVYAYKKLFLFWVERSTIQNTDASQKKYSVERATIRYSFYNYGKDWTPPQTLLADQIIGATGSQTPGDFNKLFGDKFFDMGMDVWKQVYCLVIKPHQYNSLVDGSNVSEKLIIFYGPALNTSITWDSTNLAPVNNDVKEIKQLNTWLYKAAQNFEKVRGLGYEGNLPAYTPIVLDDNLKVGFLHNPNEIIFLKNDAAGYFQEHIDRYAGKLNLLPTTQTIVDNYHNGSESTIKIPANGTPVVSSAMADKNMGVFQVKNHPAAFVFRGGEEDFLLLDESKPTPSISAMAFNADTQFNDNSFVSPISGLIDATGSKQIFSQLTTDGFLDSNGVLIEGLFLEDYKTELKTIIVDSDITDKIALVLNILSTQAKFDSSSFINLAPDVNLQPTGSLEVFKTLQTQGYLDKEGRLNAEVDFYDLYRDLVDKLGLNLTEIQAKFVSDVLFQAGFPTSIGLEAPQPAAPAIGTYQFTATRLTSAAIGRLSRNLFVGDTPGLLSLSTQQIPEETTLPVSKYKFNSPQAVILPAAIDGAEVDFDGAFSLYYWEIFFHAPQLVFQILKTDQQFSEAETWAKYIFNPTAPKEVLDASSFITPTIGGVVSSRIFTTLSDAKVITSDGLPAAGFSLATLTPLLQRTLTANQIQSVYNILLNHVQNTEVTHFWQFWEFRNKGLEPLKDQLVNTKEIDAYHDHPFDPFAIASIRIGAYEKAIVMQYIDNLLDWGDSLFRQYTWESITTATMYYIYAYNLLGARPQNVGICPSTDPKTYKQISDAYQDKIPEFLIALEHLVQNNAPALPGSPYNQLDTYFCIPENTNFVGYWDRVEDRLNKIRHGLNIDGQAVPLALFQPPIDPMALARAAASGANVLALFSGSRPPVAYYRFSYLLERARNFSETVSQLGSALLDALEKKDAATLESLRSTQERAILKLTTYNYKKQIEEQEAIVSNLTNRQTTIKNRKTNYETWISGGYNAGENGFFAMQTFAEISYIASGIVSGIAIAGYVSPDIFGLADGGMEWGDAIEAGSRIADSSAEIFKTFAEISAKSGELNRRSEEWEFAKSEAADELDEIEKEIEAAKIRKTILDNELEIHEENIAQAKEYEEFLKSKFTQGELYQWMVGRITSVYFQSYQLAQEMALIAQTAYQYELSRDETDTFIDFQYWDASRNGLLAGEGLTLSLNLMEKAFVDNYVPLYEIEKNVSLLHLDPLGFMNFKTGLNGSTKGNLTIKLTEALYDYDFPGHFDRKIKAVSLTFVGSKLKSKSVNATLVQTMATTLLKADPAAVKALITNTTPPDGTTRTAWLPNQSVALSRRDNDSGLFTLDFRFPEDTFYPFEGTGAVSEWTLTVDPDNNQMNLSQISDIIMTVKYTAQDGGTTFKDSVKTALSAAQIPYPKPLVKLLSLKNSVSAANWNTFLSTPNSGNFMLQVPLVDGTLITGLSDVILGQTDIYLYTGDAVTKAGFVTLALGGSADKPVPITNNQGTITLTGSETDPTADNISLKMIQANLPDELKDDNGKLNGAVLKDIVLAIHIKSSTT